MGLITNEEIFKKTSEGLVKMAKDVFFKDKNHAHMVFFIPKDDNRMPVLLFDQVAQQLAQETKRGEPLAHADRTLTYNAIAGIAYQMKAVGYFEIAEAWGLTHEVSDAKKSPEEVLEKYRKVIEEHKFIQNMPIKVELLTVRGRYRNTTMMSAWKIRRQLEAVWLEPFHKSKSELEFSSYQFEEMSRASEIDRAVDKVIAEVIAEEKT